MLDSCLLVYPKMDGRPPAGCDLRSLRATFLLQRLFHLFFFCRLILSAGFGLVHVPRHCSAPLVLQTSQTSTKEDQKPDIRPPNLEPHLLSMYKNLEEKHKNVSLGQSHCRPAPSQKDLHRCPPEISPGERDISVPPPRNL